MNVFYGYFGASIVAAVAWRLRALSPSGAVAAVAVGGTIFAFGDLSATTILLAFFLSGSLLSRLNERHAGARDWKQVLANGLVPTLAIVLLAARHDLRPEATLLFLGSLATATADTWATEFGKRFGTNVYDCLSLRPMTPGLSGGISLVGTLASIVGATVIAALSLVTYPNDVGLCGLVFVKPMLVVPIAGVCGALVDSIIGSALQAKYKTSDGTIIEEQRSDSEHLRGLRWLGNNATNLISTFIGGIVAVGIADWF